MPQEPEANSSPPSLRIEDGDSLAFSGRAGSKRDFPAGSRFKDIVFLGEGGMGRVYRAEDPLLGRTVALKLALEDSDVALMRFTGEAQAQARIDHPHVAKVFEVGETRGTPFIVMQFIQGGDLASAQARLSLTQLARIMRQVAEGAEAAHKLGLLHRDLKPQNILVEGLDTLEPHPFLMDFGLVKGLDSHGLTTTGVTLGTPRYMSPEQVQGHYESMDARSDVYSLGATMYEVFGGGPLFGQATDLQLLRKVIEEEPAPLSRVAPQVPEDLAVIVHTCLAKDPPRRYPSAQALAEDLGRFLMGEPIWARRPSLGYRLNRTLKRHKSLVLVGAAALLSLLALGAWSLRSVTLSRRQAVLAGAFGQRAQRLENLLRLAFMAPEHPVRPQIEAASLEMERLRAALRQGGKPAVGPGNWALGEGLLALGETDEALACLDAAWAVGFRTPEVAFTRGRALVQKFLEGKEVLPGIEDDKAREAERANLDARYKTPALDMLKQARGLPGGGPLLAAQIALLEGRQEDALRDSAAALEAEPWRFEACMLQFQVWKERLDQLRTAGDHTGAAHAHDRVEAIFQRARAIAPSHPEIWTQYGTECLDRAGGPVAITGGQTTEALMERARASYDRALALDPKWVAALNNRSEIAWRYAVLSHMKGDNPDSWLRTAVADAETSLAIDPGQPRAHLVLARALLLKANILVDQRAEAGPELERGAAAILQAQEWVKKTGAFMGWGAFFNVEAQFLALKGANARNHGQDGRDLYRLAVRSAQRMLEASPGSLSSLGLAGSIRLMLADAEDRQGGDPMPVLGEAQGIFERLLQEVSEHPQVLRDTAEVHRIRASQLVRRKQDPGTEVAAAQRLLAKGLAKAPDFHELHQVKGRLAFVRARWDRHLGRSEAASMAAAREALMKAKRLNSRIADLNVDLEEVLAFQQTRPRRP